MIKTRHTVNDMIKHDAIRCDKWYVTWYDLYHGLRHIYQQRFIAADFSVGKVQSLQTLLSHTSLARLCLFSNSNCRRFVIEGVLLSFQRQWVLLMFKMVPSISYNGIIVFIYFTVIYTYCCVVLHMLLVCFYEIFWQKRWNKTVQSIWFIVTCECLSRMFVLMCCISHTSRVSFLWVRVHLHSIYAL